MVAVSRFLTACGLDVLRFNFLYREAGLRRPDPMPLLVECMAGVAAIGVDKLRPRRTFLGGRSMGGRAATVLAANGHPCDGLLLLAYPLHPAGQPDRLRSSHLADIRVPVLCFNGTRDSLCRRELMETAIRGLDGWTMHWLEAADHGFHVTKSSGRTDEDVLQEIADQTASWLSRFPARSG